MGNYLTEKTPRIRRLMGNNLPENTQGKSRHKDEIAETRQHHQPLIPPDYEPYARAYWINFL